MYWKRTTKLTIKVKGSQNINYAHEACNIKTQMGASLVPGWVWIEEILGPQPRPRIPINNF